MSDDFIPLNQSTPVQRNGHQGQGYGRNQQSLSGGSRNNQGENGNSRGYNGRRNCSFIGPDGRAIYMNKSNYSSDNNSYNKSYRKPKVPIDAYLDPSMLKDPWAELRRNV